MIRAGVRRVALLPIIAILLALGLPACSGSSSSLKGTTITMPVLWAGPDASGEIQSGIEKAKVTVGNLGSTAFGLDLADVEAKAAGPQWRAATSSAAAVAVFASAADPADVDIRYTITGPIDGPSGGALLTVGTLAAIRGDTLATDVTMTGTISPDSTIGRVGDIPAKLRAASKAGYRIVLLPAGNLVASGESSTTDMIAYGRSLGLDVRGVDFLSAAYEVFTGVKLRIDDGATAASKLRLSAGSEVAARATTTALVDRLRTTSVGASIPAADATTVARNLDSATTALANGDLSRAYGLAVDGYTVLDRALGAAKVTATIATSGVTGARESMLADVRALRATAAATLLAGSDVAGADAIVQLGAPFALGWTTYADAVLAGIETGLSTGTITAAGLTATGSAIGEQRASIEVFQPDALVMLRSAPNPTVTTKRPAAEFLSDYTDFMVQAGRANADYYTAVIARSGVSRTDAKGNPAFAILALDELTRETASIPSGVQAVDDEIRQSALAVTYFVIGTGLVSNTTEKGISGSGLGVDAVSTVDIPGLVVSVVEAADIAGDYIVALTARGIDSSSTLWSGEWGVATATALNGTGRDAMGEVIAQNELWYDVIAMASMWAATTPR